MITSKGKDLGEYVLSGNSKDGYELKCKFCGKVWFNKTTKKTCSKECYSELCRKQMTENNPLNNPEIRERQKIANGRPECREKKRKYTTEHNPMHNPETKEKHRLKMESMRDMEDTPFYTDKHREVAKTPECREKKSISTKASYEEGRHPMCFLENKLKVSLSNSKPITEVKNFSDYQLLVWQITSRNLISHKNEIEDYDIRGKEWGYELDHIYSISEGHKNNIDPNIIGHWKNLRVISAFSNDMKWTRCDITIEDLLEVIRKCEETNE